MILVQVKSVFGFKIDMNILTITGEKAKLCVIIKPSSQATSLPVMKCVDTSQSGGWIFSQEVLIMKWGNTP